MEDTEISQLCNAEEPRIASTCRDANKPAGRKTLKYTSTSQLLVHPTNFEIFGGSFRNGCGGTKHAVLFL